MLALESQCIPVVIGGCPRFRNNAKPLKNKQEYKGGKYMLPHANFG